MLSRPFVVTVCVSGLNKHQRRTFIMGLIRAMAGHVRHLGMGWLDTNEIPDTRHYLSRYINLKHAPAVETPHGKLGILIRLKRQETGMTQAEMAEMLDLNPSHLSELERGFYRPRRKTLEKIKFVLGLEPLEYSPKSENVAQESP